MRVPTVTVSQMREVDRLMVAEFGIELLQMMENAGRALAAQARRMLGGNVRGRRVAVLAGRGANGGGGLAAARRLAIWGGQVVVLTSGPREAFTGASLRQWETLERMQVPVHPQAGIAPADLTLSLTRKELLVDALVGYGLHGAPRGAEAALIQAANDAGPPLLALDVPSGLNADTGAPEVPTIRAQATLTLALPKIGLMQPQAGEWVGALYLADISVPAAVWQRLGIAVDPIFAGGDVIPLQRAPAR